VILGYRESASPDTTAVKRRFYRKITALRDVRGGTVKNGDFSDSEENAMNAVVL
jgi:hypothetical protein